MFAIFSLDSCGRLFHLSAAGDWRRAYSPSAIGEHGPKRFDSAADAVQFAAEFLIPALPECVDSYVADGSLETAELLAS